MSATLESIRARDARQSAITKKLEAPIPVALEGTIFETTSRVMASLVDRMEHLKDGILDLGNRGNLYCVNVLFRVFLEHVLRTLAVFMRASTDHSDDFAERYLQLGLSEAFEYLNAYETAGLDIADSPKGVLNQWFPQARSLSEKEVRKLAEPFRYGALIKTIRELVPTDSPGFLDKIIPNYSSLSGFVHGGPSAGQSIDSFCDKGARAKEILRIADLTVAMFHSAERWLLVLATAAVPSLQPVLAELSSAMDEGDMDANKPDAADPRASGR